MIVLCFHWWFFFSFFFNDTATTEIYTLSLHDALPIFGTASRRNRWPRLSSLRRRRRSCPADRKSTRLNSSHLGISYAVFCLKKKKSTKKTHKMKVQQNTLQDSSLRVVTDAAVMSRSKR